MRQEPRVRGPKLSPRRFWPLFGPEPPPKDPRSKWFEALQQARRSLQEEESHMKQAILRERAQTIMEQWRTGNKDRNAKQQRTD